MKPKTYNLLYLHSPLEVIVIEKPIFVTAAEISAHLYFATQVAKRISLTAKNARAITVRAGQQAAGFKAITDFIEDLAKSTISSAEIINDIAVKISRMATEQAKNDQALDYFNKVINHSSRPEFIDSIQKAQSDTQGITQQFEAAFTRELSTLAIHLEETSKQIRSANIIASTSKIEASQSGNFQLELETIAHDIEGAAKEIRFQINEAEKLLVQSGSSQINI